MKKGHTFQRRAYEAAYSVLRRIRARGVQVTKAPGSKQRTGPRIAFIHNERKIASGAHQINELMSSKIRERGFRVKNFYPRQQLLGTPSHLRGVANILFFHSLLEHKDEILQHDIIQGTTYTTLPFISFEKPVVSHFGSTTQGFLHDTPKSKDLPAKGRKLWRQFHREGILRDFDFETYRPLQDIADIEALVALKATACVATSQKVADELALFGVPQENIHVIHNAIEDYWFTHGAKVEPGREPRIVFLGRLGDDTFNLRLKGLDRLAEWFSTFKETRKLIVCMTTNQGLKSWLRSTYSNLDLFVNLRKDLIPNVLGAHAGSIMFISSRYEGFSLSLIEGMSQGLVPITYPVGVAPEIIRDGENGFLVSTIEEAITRTKELLADETTRLAMARRAIETASQFTSDRIAEDLTSLYRKIRSADTAARKANGNGHHSLPSVY